MLIDYQENSLELILPLLKDLVREGEINDMWLFNRGIDNILNMKQDPMEEVESLLSLLSPFNAKSLENFEKVYPREGGINNGLRGGITHNGGYQELAYLYAAVGDLDRVIQSTDSVIKYNSNYWQLHTYNNGYNILGYLLQFDHYEKAELYLNYLLSKTGYDEIQFYSFLLDRTGYLKTAFNYGFDYNPGLSMLPFDKVEWIFDAYEQSASSIPNLDERRFYKAHCFKLRGLYMDRNRRDGKINASIDEINRWFDSAIEEYESLESSFLDKSIDINYRYFGNGPRSKNWTKKYYFLYPDQLSDGFFSGRVTSNAFIKYILDNDLLSNLYTSVDDLESINDWLANYYEYTPFQDPFRNLDPLDLELLTRYFQAIKLHSNYEDFDNTFFNLLLANGYFDLAKFEGGYSFFEAINYSKLQVMANRWEYVNFTFIYNQILKMAKYLAAENMHDHAMDLIELLPNNNYKSIVYSNVADFLYDGSNRMKAFVYLDSAMIKGEKVDKSQITFPDYRYQLIQTMSGMGGRELNNIAKDMFVELSPGLKSGATNFYVVGIAWEGNYYKALQAILPDDPANSRMGHYSNILNEEGNKRPIQPGWEKYRIASNLWFKEFIPFNLNF